MNRKASVYWSDADIARLAALLRERRHSLKALSEMTGRSKGAISGMVWRHPLLAEIGLLPPPETVRKMNDRRKAKIERAMGRRPRSFARPLVELESWCCRFPMWGHYERVAPEEMLFCAQVKANDSSYCERHRKMCANAVRSVA